ncbi:MAG: hypothetical protein NWS78_12355, partial [Gammaproteobacteria bacterium]|nr:hypothetical protein [Gammaproteobacteria bacterium]
MAIEYNLRQPLGEPCDPISGAQRTPFQPSAVLAHCVLKFIITLSRLTLRIRTLGLSPKPTLELTLELTL